MKPAICPGSFDPVTLGHLDIIERAAELFDEVIVLVMSNRSKSGSLFTVEERIELINRTIKGKNIKVDTYDGLLVDYAKQKNAVAIVKGLRAMSDFEYEFQMALVNRNIYDGAETVFLTTSSENMYLSSSVVKQVAFYGGDISKFVPEFVAEEVKRKISALTEKTEEK